MISSNSQKVLVTGSLVDHNNLNIHSFHDIRRLIQLLLPWMQFLSKTLCSHTASLHPDIQMGASAIKAGGNPAMD